MIDINRQEEKTTLFFRANKTLKNPTVKITVDSKEIFKKKYLALRPPEMEKIEVDFNSLKEDSKVEFTIEV